MTREDIYKASSTIFEGLPDQDTFSTDMQDSSKASKAYQNMLDNKDEYEKLGVQIPSTVEEFQAIVTTDPKKKSTDTGSNGSQKTQQSSGSKPAQSSQQGPKVFQPQRVFNSAEEIDNYFGYLDQYKNDPNAQKEKQWFDQNYPTISEQFYNQGGKPLTVQGPVYEEQKEASFKYDPGTLPKLQQKSTINNADLKDKSIGESSTDEYTIDPKTGKKIWKRLTDEELLGDVIENTQQKQDVMQIPVNIQQVAVDSEKKAKREEEAAKTKGMTFQQIEEQYKQDLEEIDKKELYRKNYDFIESMIDNQFGGRSNDIDFKKLNIRNRSEVENAYGLLEQDYLEYLQKTDPQEYERVNNEITAIKGKKSDERSLGEREVLENYRVQAMRMHNLLNGYVMTKLEKDYDIKGFYGGINVINSQVEAIDKQLEEMNIDPSGRGVTQPMMDKYNELVQKRNKLVNQVAGLAEKTGVTSEIQAKYEDALGRYTDFKITTSQLRSLDSEVMKQKEENMIAAKKRFDEAMSGNYSFVDEFARGYAGTVGKSFVDFIGRTWDVAGEALGDTDYDIFDQMSNFVKGYTLQKQETFGTAQDMAFMGEPKKYEDLPLIYRLNNLTSSGLASISLAASGSLATGAIGLGSTVGGGLLMLGSSLADNYEEALSMGYSGQEAAEYSSSIAAAEYMIESVFPDFNFFKLPQARNTYFQALKKTNSVKEALAVTFEQLPQSLKYQSKKSADNLVKEGVVEEGGAQVMTDLIKTGFNEQNKDKGQFETFQSQDYIDTVLGGWLGAEGARVTGRLAKQFMPHEESAFYQAAINPQILKLAQSNEVEFPDEVQEIVDEFAVINNAMKSKPGWDNMTDDEKAHVVSEVRRMKYLESKNKEVGIDDPGTKEEISNIKAAVEQYIDQARNNPKFKLPQYALQEPSTEEVLPRQQGATTETGGEPQGMGQSVQGEKATQQGQKISQEDIEAKKADIEKRRQEELNNVGIKQKERAFSQLRDEKDEDGKVTKVRTPEEKLNAINLIERNVAEGSVLTKEEQKELQKTKDELASQGYEVPKILDIKYHQGMKVIVTNSISDESLAEGEEVITKVLTPQINKDGKIVQTAQIEVTVGTKKGGLTREQWLEQQKKKQKRTDKINAKYDAELAALEGQEQAPTNIPPSTQEGQEQVSQDNELDPDLANIDPLIIAARNGDVDAQNTLNEYGLDWEQTTTYRFIGNSEVETLLSNNKVESRRFTDVGIDVTTSPKVTSASNSEYRVTFKESFDLNNGLGKVRVKSRAEGDHNLEKGRGYSLEDVAKIERLDENGNVVETLYDTKQKSVEGQQEVSQENIEATAKALEGVDQNYMKELPFLFNHSTQMFDYSGNKIEFKDFDYGSRIFKVGETTVQPIWFSKKPYASGDEIRQIKTIISTSNPFDFNNKIQRNNLESFAFSKYGEKYKGLSESIEDGEWESLELDYDRSIPALIKEAGYDSYFSKEGEQVTIAVFNPEQIKIATSQSISEAYHKAKEDGSNPELVEAVEELLGKKEKTTPTETVQAQEVEQEVVKKEDVVNQPFGELPENTEDFTGIGAGYLKNNLWASKQLGKDSKTSLLGNVKNEVLNKGKKAFLYFIDPKLSEGQLDTENKYNTKLNDKINAQGNKTLSGAENAAIENEVGAELAKEGVKGELVSDEKDGTYRIFDTKNTELLGYIEATPELIEKISDPNISEEQAKQILFDEAGVKMGDNVLIHANENDITKYKPQEQKGPVNKKEDLINKPFGKLPIGYSSLREIMSGVNAGYLPHNIWTNKELDRKSSAGLFENIKSQFENNNKDKVNLYFLDPKLSNKDLAEAEENNSKFQEIRDKVQQESESDDVLKDFGGDGYKAFHNLIDNKLAKAADEGLRVSSFGKGGYRIHDSKNTDLVGYLEVTPELMERISDPNISEEEANAILKKEAGVPVDKEVFIHINENDLSKYKTQKDVESEDYVGKLEEAKKQKPEKFWSVSTPPVGAVKGGTIIKVKGGEALVDNTGDIRGLYKYPDTEERGVGDQLVKKGIEAGGVKLDNFALDNLMDIYQRNGFRVVSRMPFSEKDAPEGWNKKKHGTPDVVAMVYDPENKLDIEERQFTKDQYDEAIAYRDSFVDAQKEAYGEQKTSQDEEAKRKSIADIIRGLKSKGGKLYSAGLGIPVAIWDGAVEIIASAVQAGESVSKALNKAKKYLKDNLKDKYNEEVFNKLKEETEKQSGQKSNALNIDVESVRKKDRPGKRISKGLAKKSEDKKTIFLETDDISVDYVKKKAPQQFIKNAKIIADYPLVKAVRKSKPINTVEDAQEVYDIFVRQVADNLKYLMDEFDPEFKEIATLWYDGANAIANELAEEYGITPEQVAGILASLSPQKDWYQNVRLAELVLMAYKDNPVLSQEMLDYQKSVIEKSLYKDQKAPAKQLKKAEKKYKENKTKANKIALDEAKQKFESAVKDSDDVMSMLEEYIGKKMDQVPEYIQPYMVRTYHEVNTTKDYDIITPDGNKAGIAKKANGDNSKVAWGSYGEIGKAVSIYNNGSSDNITRTLGEMHKIRNFNNNIIDPMSKDGDVTIDTHAVAAALLIPLSGTSKEVGQNFGTGTGNSPAFGIKGLYFAYSDGYALAAKETGLLPRQVQSITWEAVRGLYTKSFKANKENVNDIKQIWKKYEDGEITIEQARELAKQRAGGINEPTWATGSLIDEPGESDQEENDGARTDGDGSDTVRSERKQPDGDLLTEAVEMLSDAQESGGTEVTKAQKEVTEKLGEEGKKIAEIDRNFDKLADDLGFIKTCII